jgi:hypothetical protein
MIKHPEWDQRNQITNYGKTEIHYYRIILFVINLFFPIMCVSYVAITLASISKKSLCIIKNNYNQRQKKGRKQTQ